MSQTPEARTLKSIATMLGWEHVPPQDTLEQEIRALKYRASLVSTPAAGEAAALPHDWRWDDVFKVYRCWRCLVAGDKPHDPACPKGEALAVPVRETPEHRCSGCGHRWDGPLTGAELCGDCWRTAQPTLHTDAVPVRETEEDVIEIDEDGNVRALGPQSARDLAELNSRRKQEVRETPADLARIVEDLRAFAKTLSAYQDTYQAESALMDEAADALSVAEARHTGEIASLTEKLAAERLKPSGGYLTACLQADVQQLRDALAAAQAEIAKLQESLRVNTEFAPWKASYQAEHQKLEAAQDEIAQLKQKLFESRSPDGDGHDVIPPRRVQAVGLDAQHAGLDNRAASSNLADSQSLAALRAALLEYGQHKHTCEASKPRTALLSRQHLRQCRADKRMSTWTACCQLKAGHSGPHGPDQGPGGEWEQLPCTCNFEAVVGRED